MPTVDRIEQHSFFSRGIGPEATVIDLGLNHGHFASKMIARYGCRVVGVEPAPALFERLPRDPMLTVEHVAVSGTDGHAMLHLNRAHDAATLTTSLAEADAEMVNVPTTTLASLLARHGAERVTLLKVDIEGAEIELLRTADEEVLARIDQITIEYHDFLDPSLTPLIEDVNRRLEAFGFRRVRFSLDNTDVVHLNTAILDLSTAELACTLVLHKLAPGVARRLRRLLGRWPLGSRS